MIDYFVRFSTTTVLKNALTDLGLWDVEANAPRELTFEVDTTQTKLPNKYQGYVIAVYYIGAIPTKTGLYTIVRMLNGKALPNNLPNGVTLLPIEDAPVRFA